MTQTNLAGSVAAAAADAVEDARKRYGVNLDFSEASIKEVERILGLVHKDYLASGGRGPTVEDLQLGAMMYGGYIGEVLCKSIGGAWQMQEGAAAVSNAKGSVFPIEKAYKRLNNGPEDDVAFFFERALAHLKS